MPTIDGMNLYADPLEQASGAAFLLREKAVRNHTEQPYSGWVLEVRRDSRFAVIRGPRVDSYSDAVVQAIDACQAGLDMMAMRGFGFLATEQLLDEHLCWWWDGAGVVLTYLCIHTRSVSIGPVRGVVMRDGQVVPQTPHPNANLWHPSFRYYRMAQTTDDLFDGYRNLYLALESLLSHAVPKAPGEADGRWIRRAFESLSQSGAVKFARWFGAPEADAWQKAYDELYKTKRNQLFHAKTGLVQLQPQDHKVREDILRALEILARVYLELAASQGFLHAPGGGLTAGGFSMMMEPFEQKSTMFATDDPEPWSAGDKNLNPGGGSLVELKMTVVRRPGRGLERDFVGSTLAADLASLPRITKIGLTVAGEPYVGAILEGVLVLNGVGRFEHIFRIRASNAQEPRRDYPL